VAAASEVNGAAGREVAGGPVLPAVPVAAARSLANLRDELGVLYLVVILGGLAAFAFASVFRTKGVQRTWNS